MKKVLLLVLFVCYFPLNLFAASDDLSQSLYDSVHFAENGNEIVVEIDKIQRTLADGANTNWINSKVKRHESVLAHFVMLVSLSNNPVTTDKGINAIKLLFEHNAKLQYCDGSILFWPISGGKYEIVKILLEKGASPKFWPKDEIGSDITPIEEATQDGYDSIAELLVRYGAKKLEEKYAVQIRFIEAARFASVNELNVLVKKGAKVNSKNRQEKTALINALGCFFNYESYIKVSYLLDLGADVNLKGKGQLGITTPLHEAIYFSSFLYLSGVNRDRSYAENILQDLIKKGAFVSSRDEDDKTPLLIAAKYNHLYAAQILLESGAKVMDRDKSGKKPLDYAESSEMINLLKKYGTKDY